MEEYILHWVPDYLADGHGFWSFLTFDDYSDGLTSETDIDMLKSASYQELRQYVAQKLGTEIFDMELQIGEITTLDGVVHYEPYYYIWL